MKIFIKDRTFLVILTFLLCSCSTKSQSYSYPIAKQYAAIPSPVDVEAMEDRLTVMVNQFRSKKGLCPLVQWKALKECARKHSRDMAQGVVGFGHEGFDHRAKDIGRVVSLSSFGENVAYTYMMDDPLQTSLVGWIKSPPHCKNLLGDFKETGIGIAFSNEGKCYLTQLFSRKMSEGQRKF